MESIKERGFARRLIAALGEAISPPDKNRDEPARGSGIAFKDRQPTASVGYDHPDRLKKPVKPVTF
ncbi:hypothetical protein BH09PSE5_BH09PSE5_48900 [soil metagenome]